MTRGFQSGRAGSSLSSSVSHPPRWPAGQGSCQFDLDKNGELSTKILKLCTIKHDVYIKLCLTTSTHKAVFNCKKYCIVFCTFPQQDFCSVCIAVITQSCSSDTANKLIIEIMWKEDEVQSHYLIQNLQP